MEPVAADSIRGWLHRVWGPSLHIGRFRHGHVGLRQATCAANDEIAAHLALRPGGRILDVGCGFGALSEAITAKSSGASIGIDPERWRLERGRAMYGAALPLVAASALHLPFGSAAFDGCAAVESLSYTESPADGVLEIGRVLRRGGRMVILDYFVHPSVDGQPGLFPNDARHLLTRDRWRQLVSSQGLIVCEEDWSGDGAATYRWLYDVFRRVPDDRQARLAADNMRARLAVIEAGRVGHLLLVAEK